MIRSTKRSDGPSLPTALSKPTFAVESSPGNHQFVYVLDKSATVDEAKDLLSAIAKAKVCDSHGNNPIRWFRLPGGVNGKEEPASATSAFDSQRSETLTRASA